jgi:hypothetical protein
VRLPLPENGPWQDLLANFDGSLSLVASDNHLDLDVGSHWGHIFFRQT